MENRSSRTAFLDRLLRPFLPRSTATDPDRAQRARHLVLGAGLAGLAGCSLLVQLAGREAPTHLWAVAALTLVGAALVIGLVRRDRVGLASYALPTIAIGLGAVIQICEGGAPARASVLVVGVIMAGLLVRPAAALAYTAAAVAIIVLAHLASEKGWVVPSPLSPESAWLSSLRMVVLSGLLVTLLAGTLRSTIDRLRNRERELMLSLAELERARAAEDDASARLRQAEKLETIGRLAGGVAHDFNNLLTVILGNSSLVLAGEDDPRLTEEILAAAERGAQLTGQLLALSKQEPVPPRRIEVQRAVESVRPLLERLLGEPVAIETNFEATSDALRADPGRFDQILVNLALNAQAAMPDGGTIRFRTRDATTPGRFLLEVRDTGEGMSPEVREQLFEPFFSTRAGGTGLGLATVHRIVAELEGSIVVESRPGAGTTFLLEFPCATPDADSGVPRDVPAPLPTASGTVVLVEDDDVVRRALERQLKSLGHEVLSVDGSESARATLLAHGRPVLLALIDVVLSKGFGPNVAAAIREVQPECPIVFMSGYTAGELERHRIDGADGFLRKPFTAAQLRVAIDTEVAEAGQSAALGRVSPRP